MSESDAGQVSLSAPKIPRPTVPTIRFEQEGQQVGCIEGANLRKAALDAGINPYKGLNNLNNCGGVGQCGTNQETGTELFGHSLTVDPWGEVLGRLEEPTPGLLTLTCRRARLETVRSTLPALDHRRFTIELAQDPTTTAAAPP